MSLPDASSNELSPPSKGSSEGAFKTSANVEGSVSVEQMEVGSGSQERYQGFLQWLTSTDECPGLRALNGFIWHHTDICNTPILDEQSFDEFIKDFDFVGLGRGGNKSVIETLTEHCENKMKTFNVKSEETDSDCREVAGEEPNDQNTEENEESLANAFLRSRLDIWIRCFNPSMQCVADYLDTSSCLVERWKMMDSDKERENKVANELNLFLEKLRVMKRRAKSMKEALHSPS